MIILLILVEILLVDDQENWYELSNSTYYLTENTTLLYGDIITFNYFGEIGEVTYSDTHCESDTTDEYGYVEMLHTILITHLNSLIKH